MDKKKFGEIIKEKRKDKNLSLKEASGLIGISAAVLFRYEKGRSFPTPKHITKLCDVLELNSHEIFRLIQLEKNPTAKIADYLEPNPYPELRLSLLSFYTEKYNKKTYTSLNKIKEIIETLPFHPIEKVVISEVHKIFKLSAKQEIADFINNIQHGVSRINIGFTGRAALYDNLIDLLKHLSLKGKNLLLQKANFKWSYDSKTQNIIFITQDNNLPLKFSLWKEIAK